MLFTFSKTQLYKNLNVNVEIAGEATGCRISPGLRTQILHEPWVDVYGSTLPLVDIAWIELPDATHGHVPRFSWFRPQGLARRSQRLMFFGFLVFWGVNKLFYLTESE